jgi:PAS domain S-box-containing protein
MPSSIIEIHPASATENPVVSPEKKTGPCGKGPEKFHSLLEAIMESSEDGIAGKSPEGIITSWNQGAERLFGYSAAEAIGRSFSICLPPGYEEEEEEIRKCIQRGGHFSSYETIRKRKDGSLVDVSLTISPLRDPTGRILGASSINRDISQRKRNEATLLRQSGRLELLAETADQLLSTDKPATVIQTIFQKLQEQIEVDVYFNFLVNETGDALWLHSYGGIPGEVARQISRLEFGQAACGTVALERRPLVFTNIQQSESPIVQLVKDFALRAYACNPLLADGRLLGTLAFGSRTKDAFAKEELELFQTISRYLALALDRWRLLQEAMQRANELETRVAERTTRLEESMKSLEGLLYHVAHDLRAPLRAMHSFTQLLLDDYAPNLDARGEDYAQRIAEASGKMDALIGDLLHYGRLVHQPLSWVCVDLNNLVHAVVAGFADEIAGRQAEIDIDPSLPRVWADRRILEQVLANLLCNGLKFARPGVPPRICIWAETAGRDAVRLYIKDNGLGIEPQYQDRIYKVFERLHDADAYPGTGIGLAIVKKGMERLGGSIGMESKPNAGSCFWLELKPVLSSS